MGSRLDAPDESAALEQLHALGCTDGLPVVIPTPDRVDRMVLAGGLDPDVVIGAAAPNLGEATVEKLAAHAVMAGRVPEGFPGRLPALQALCDPVLGLP